MTKPKPQKLPRCPYCGAKFRIFEIRDAWLVHCSQEGGSHGFFIRKTPAAAIHAASERVKP